MKVKCSKGEECACWHSPSCRFFKDGNGSAGDKCQLTHESARDMPVVESDAGGDDEGNQPNCRGTSPTRRGTKSGAEVPVAVCISSTGAIDNTGVGGIPACLGLNHW